MESSDSKDLRAPSQPVSTEERLSELFGSYKAEWLKERLYDLFTEPSYFPELRTARPCMLVGGRGTGKTTVLRCLSYEGQFALAKKRVEAIDSFPFIGLYYRVNTNRVTAFKGAELEEPDWIRLFAHYFNLVTSDLALRFLQWYHLHRPDTPQLQANACELVAESLHLPRSSTTRDLAENMDQSRLRFEAHINNVADGERPLLSLQGAPLDVLMDAIASLPQFAGRNFFFLLDEYENFEDYQQQVVNTLIKHSGQTYTFKVGIRELGWRRRATLNANEQLISPADYVRINITEKLAGRRFSQFALDVCNARISQLAGEGAPPLPSVAGILPDLSEEEEAIELGVEELVARTRQRASDSADPRLAALMDASSPLMLYFLESWASKKGQQLEDLLGEFLADPEGWRARYENHRHSLLYTIRRRKRGIRKYYAGWDTFLQLAACNIRYLLELVDQCLSLHLKNGEDLASPVPFKTQTEAAQGVGRKNLFELEGLGVYGAQLTKLLLGLGRVLNVMAAQPVGHAPEVNSFVIRDENEDRDSDSAVSTVTAVDRLVTSAVMHLALLRFPGSKPSDETDTRAFEYMMHPIFSAFFVFSHRHKRKMLLSSRDLLGLVRAPQETIREILARSDRIMDDSMPEQLQLFRSYYGGGEQL